MCLRHTAYYRRERGRMVEVEASVIYIFFRPPAETVSLLTLYTQEPQVRYSQDDLVRLTIIRQLIVTGRDSLPTETRPNSLVNGITAIQICSSLVKQTVRCVHVSMWSETECERSRDQAGFTRPSLFIISDGGNIYSYILQYYFGTILYRYLTPSIDL